MNTFQPPALLRTPWPAATAIILLALVAVFTHPSAGQALLTANPLWHALLPQAPMPLAAPAAFFLAVAALRCTGHGWPHTNLFTLLTALAFLPAIALAHSFLPAWSLLAFGTIQLLTRHHITRLEKVTLTITLGALSGAYVLFAYLPLLTGLTLFAVWPKRATNVALWSTFIAFTTHAAGYLLLPAAYIPLTAGTIPLHGPALAAAIALTLIVLAQSLYHWRWWPPLQHATWFVATPLAILTFAALAPTPHHPTLWSSLILLTPIAPFACHLILKNNLKSLR